MMDEILELMRSKIIRTKDHSENEIARGILAGIYISLGGLFMAIAKSKGMNPIICSASFSLGLFLVVTCNGELFTGNCLLKIHDIQCDKKPLSSFVVLFNNYIANLIGSLFIFILVIPTGIDLSTLSEIAVAKCNLSIIELFTRAIFCNILVCLGVWCATYTTFCKDAISKFIAVLLPVTAFVFCGFEHSIADIFFFPFGVLDGSITLLDCFVKLGVVTIGNYIGGCYIAILLNDS